MSQDPPLSLSIKCVEFQIINCRMGQWENRLIHSEQLELISSSSRHGNCQLRPCWIEGGAGIEGSTVQRQLKRQWSNNNGTNVDTNNNIYIHLYLDHFLLLFLLLLLLLLPYLSSFLSCIHTHLLAGCKGHVVCHYIWCVAAGSIQKIYANRPSAA